MITDFNYTNHNHCYSEKKDNQHYCMPTIPNHINSKQCIYSALRERIEIGKDAINS